MAPSQDKISMDSLAIASIHQDVASSSSLPIINISTFMDPFSTPEERLNTALDIKRACTEYGFFYVTIHSIPNIKRDRVISLVHQFVCPPPPDTSESKHTDLKTYDTTQNLELWPNTPTTGFKSIYLSYVNKIQAVGKSVGKSVASSIDAAFALGAFTPTVAKHAKEEEGEEIFIRCGIHTNYSSVTLLQTDPAVRPLQLFTNNGQWIKADSIPGAFLVNIGNVIERQTNGHWEVARHRVIHRGDGYQVSVPFFCKPGVDDSMPIDRSGNLIHSTQKLY